MFEHVSLLNKLTHLYVPGNEDLFKSFIDGHLEENETRFWRKHLRSCKYCAGAVVKYDEVGSSPSERRKIPALPSSVYAEVSPSEQLRALNFWFGMFKNQVEHLASDEYVDARLAFLNKTLPVAAMNEWNAHIQKCRRCDKDIRNLADVLKIGASVE